MVIGEQPGLLFLPQARAKITHAAEHLLGAARVQPFLRVLAEQAADSRPQRPGPSGSIGLIGDYRGEDGKGVAARERIPAFHAGIQCRAECPHVRSGGRGLTPRTFWRHVGG